MEGSKYSLINEKEINQRNVNIKQNSKYTSKYRPQSSLGGTEVLLVTEQSTMINQHYNICRSHDAIHSFTA